MEKQALDASESAIGGRAAARRYRPRRTGSRVEAGATALLRIARTAEDPKLEAALRWHQPWPQLETAITQAQATLEQANQAHLAAADRRAHLALVSALEPARPLHAECQRLNVATQQAGAQLQTLEAGLIAADQARSLADTALAQAQQQLAAATQAQKTQQPEIETAKRLDVEIALLAKQCPDRQQHAGEPKARPWRRRSASTRTLTEQHAQTAKAQVATAAWLAAHTQHAALAE
jgi:hypothetical protein